MRVTAFTDATIYWWPVRLPVPTAPTGRLVAHVTKGFDCHVPWPHVIQNP